MKKPFMINYKSYLVSEQWAEKRVGALHLASYRCDICNTSSNLEVHHLTYDRIGNERSTDLVVLCKKHHQEWDSHRKRHKIYFDYFAKWLHEAGESWRNKYTIMGAIEKYQESNLYDLGIQESIKKKGMYDPDDGYYD